MDAALVKEVWRRANARCEYCQLSQEFDDRTFEIDHVKPQKHLGRTIDSNLALSCFRCNSFKGLDIGSWDAETGKLTALFNPRRHRWSRHFQWNEAYLVGRTAVGRVTVAVLRINDPFRVKLRAMLIEEGVFPPL